MHKGLMGGFTGRIGDKIGYIINGVQYIRSAPKKRTGPVSKEQTIQRGKFSMMTKFLSPLCPFINEVHEKSYRGEPRYHKLFSLNYRKALKGEYPDFSIDYRLLQLTTGALSGIQGIHVNCDKDACLDFHWDDNSNYYMGAHPWDRLYLAFYNEDKKCWEIKINMALREDAFVTTNMSSHRGDRLQIYAGFTSPYKRQVSNSMYLGMIKIK